MKKIFSLFCILFLASCGDATIYGTWVQPVPGMENMTQGFVLNTDGTALSVNMATLAYDTWRRDGDNLIMTGRSIGNGQIIEFTDVYEIEQLTSNTLVLRDGDITFTYTRE